MADLVARGMNILYVTDVFPPRCGGSGWSVYFFARALRERGHNVHVVALDGAPRQYDGFDVKAFSLSSSSVPFVANWMREQRDLPRIAKQIQELARNYDLVHAHHKFSAIALSLARPSRFFVTIRDYWPICICGRSTFRTETICSLEDFTRCSNHDGLWKGIAAPLAYPWFEARLRERLQQLRQAQRIFCISRFVRDQLTPLIEEDKLEVLPNIAEPITGSVPTDLPQKFLLYVGRLEENKGPQLLPEILSRAEVTIPIVIVGEGSLANEVRVEFESRRMDARFLGYREYPEMLEILKRSELVLFPSQWAEPLGRVLIEAALMGKAAVAFNHAGGHRDIVEHERTGWLAADVDDFARAISNLLSNDALRHKLGSEARAKYEREFSAAAVIPRMLDAYAGCN